MVVCVGRGGGGWIPPPEDGSTGNSNSQSSPAHRPAGERAAEDVHLLYIDLPRPTRGARAWRLPSLRSSKDAPFVSGSTQHGPLSELFL